MATGDPILDVSDLIYLTTGGGGGNPEQINITKSGLLAGGAITWTAGKLHSLWRADGQPGGASATLPTTSVAPTNATAGSLQQGTPAAGCIKRLLSFVGTAAFAGTLILYDRLEEQGGLSATTTSAQTTNLPTTALTRRTSGVGVEPWLEIYTAIGTTGTTVKCSYTNTAGTAGQVSPLVTFGGAGSDEVAKLIQLGLASGDKGVKAVASVTVTASTLTAGNFGVVLAYPLVALPIGFPGVGTLLPFFFLPGGPISLEANGTPALGMAWYANSTSVPQIRGMAYFMEK